MRKTKSGFTIVELLIVIVIIAILAAITIVAYNGMQQRARDAQRAQDMRTIAKALEMYYTIHGQYPPAGGATVINAGWSSSQDASWDTLATHLRDHISSLPKDPTNTSGAAGLNTANTYNYSYWAGGNYCGLSTTTRQMYVIGYRMEGSQQLQEDSGTCASTPTVALGNGYPSRYRVVK